MVSTHLLEAPQANATDDLWILTVLTLNKILFFGGTAF